MKIDVEESIVYRFDNKTDLSYGVEMLGENGYFSDDEDFNIYVYGALTEVKCRVPESKYPFILRNHKEIKDDYSYFIPEDSVAFKEGKPKKYRPFKDVSEFSNETGCEEVGQDVLTIRDKLGKTERVLLYIGYTTDAVYLGGFVLNFETLLEHYEFYYDNKWHPFGIEE